MRISGVSLGIGGREDGVDEDEGADDLSAKAGALGVAIGDNVSTTALDLVDGGLETLDNTSTADGTQGLHHNVENCSGQRQFPRQEQAERHRRVDVSACNIPPRYLQPFSLS